MRDRSNVTNVTQLFQYAVDQLAEWDDDALRLLNDEQLQSVIEHAIRIERSALHERDNRKS